MYMTRQQPPRSGAVELVFSLHDERCFFIAASERTGGEFIGERAVHRADGNMLEFFTVRGVRPATVLDVAADLPMVREARVVSEHSDSTLMEFVVSGPCVAATLADTDAVIRDVRADDGNARIVADVSPHGDVRKVVDRVFERHEGARLLSKRTLGDTIPGLSNTSHNAHLTADLTDKQLAAVEVATREGYFSWPRESTAAECATVMGVSQPTFSQHLWTGLEKLLRSLFETDEEVSDDSLVNDTI
ncbi:Bacterio-opsin activator HTH domain protein [Haladaptatus paucihalophilus DX253]|uniref:Bacterio-opsin activator HTH domain protein n=2 Tax=Haladaptatus paucihalophilus TaxID=367189 RepID=E7QQS9_HALPU|nr:Bacterio-opsin activator HTH domain protein [Haladaptatus paucihalophilus DX253]SHK51956.1 Predicted DNA binding protein, contains HTH domain [Haladaptatus paucihalophilus DX253]